MRGPKKIPWIALMAIGYLAAANSGRANVSALLGNGTFQAAVNFDAGLSPKLFLERLA